MKPKTLAIAGAVAVACISISAVSSTREAALVAAANQGHTQAVVDLAEFYRAQGLLEEARAALQRSAEGGNAVAQRLLAESFLGEPDGFEEAVLHYERAIALGDRLSTTELGRALVMRAVDESRPSTERAINAQRAERLLATLVREEHAGASWLIGYLKLHGPSVVRDQEAARHFLGVAADGGQSVAAYLLAREDLPPYNTEFDAPLTPQQKQTFEAGFARLVQAAEAGHRTAADELADHYQRGVWVRRDMQASQRWAGMVPTPAPRTDTSKPAPATPSPATDTLVLSDQVPAAATTLTAAAPGSEALHRQVQILTEENQRLQASLEAARKTIRRIESERDDALAKLAATERDYIALREFRALQVGADELNQSALDHIARAEYVAARPLLEAAARANHPGAIANLAWLHLHGVTVPADTAHAVALFERSAELGNAVAADNLARIFALGLGVPVDPAKSEAWRRRALAMAPVSSPDLVQR